MRVFVTGGAGWIGSRIVRELLSSGRHTVLALAHSDASVTALTAAGAEIHRGSLLDLSSLSSAAAAADGVIHCAMTHDFNDFPKMCANERNAIEAMGNALAGSNKPFIVTSATALLPSDHLVTEADEYEQKGFKNHRGPSGTLALSFAGKGVRAAIVRLPPTVHGEGDQGFIAMLIDTARKHGVSAYIGDGNNVWPAVHVNDAAHLYCLALEKTSAGSVFHAVAEEGIPMKEIATIIGKSLNVPVVSKSAEEASAHFGWIGTFVGVHNPTSSVVTQQQLGWAPTQPSLLEDLSQDYYFKGQSKYSKH